MGGLPSRVESAGPGGTGQLPTVRGGDPSMWEVLRWFAVFVLALLLMVAGLFWLMGRSLPIPNF
jgi:hypothetical protein